MIWIVLAVIGLVGLGVVLAAVGIYNNLVALRNNIDKAFANIEVILKQRFDELPKLIDTCKGYMTHERTLLENLVEARTKFLNSNSNEEKAGVENTLSAGLKTLFAVAENYPDLKANQNFLDLQNRISVLEEGIADRREFFNEAVTLYNTRIQSIPEVFFAAVLGFTPRTLLEIPDSETRDVKIQF